jgi:CHAT domain-containing protein
MGKTVEGEGVMGLTRAFIYACAQDVLCTLWPVADESTKTLMTTFYENLKTTPSIEEALRSAQGDMARRRETSTSPSALGSREAQESAGAPARRALS